MESPEKLFQELEKSYSLYIDTNFYIDIIQFKADKKTIQVMLNNKQLISSKDEISFTVNGKPINYTTYIRDDLESWKHDIGYVIRGYTFEFEWEKDCQLEILKNSEPQEFHYTVCANLSRLPQCFKESNGFVFNHNDKAVTIKRKKLLNFAIREARFWVSAAKEYGLFKGLQCAKLRTQIRFMRRAGAKNKILITDRINAGRDNGEALYRHLQKKGVKDIAFLILKDSEEGKRLAKDGFNIIQPFSKKHFFYLFTCSKIASSSFDSFIANPFRKFVTKDKPSFLSNITIDLYFGMLDFKYIFLTHGATKNDMTKVFRKENKNFNFILASNEAEAEHLKTGNYNFSDNEVVLTGLPRYDHLESEKSNTKKENIITIMPTWRKGLLPDNFVNGQRAYYSDFKKTDFYQFYNSILTDEKISKALRDFDYKIIFLLHPGLITQLEDFTSSNKRIKILHPPYNFTEIINKTKVFVTDYSSVFYDFAYAGSSVIYSQFDRGIFFTRQKYKESFWTYSDNGFGPITETLDETCKKIIKFAKHGGKPDSKYKKRYSSAFPFSDKGFCERVIEATNLLDD